jgi:hypothetical protein
MPRPNLNENDNCSDQRELLQEDAAARLVGIADKMAGGGCPYVVVNDISGRGGL